MASCITAGDQNQNSALFFRTRRAEGCDTEISGGRHEEMGKTAMNRNNPSDGLQAKKPNRLNLLLNGSIILMVIALGALAFVKLDLINLIMGSFDGGTTEYSPAQDVRALCDRAMESAKAQIKSRKPIFAIETERYVAPPPDPSRYDESLENYSDKTIEVHYSRERMFDSWFHFAEIRIKHPSQFRLALAGDEYGEVRKLPSDIAADVNAVVAVNGCFYNRRTYGFLIYKREVLRNKPFGIDVLLIDSDGNFHIVVDRKVMSSGVLDEYDIVSAVGFGPQLVRDGRAVHITKFNWEPTTNEPRTAICQFDDSLHYLICLAEGRNYRSVGVPMQLFAEVIAKKGVKTAYNLDGGQSGTLVFGNKLKNVVGWGPQKAQGDILYFATALEEDERE